MSWLKKQSAQQMHYSEVLNTHGFRPNGGPGAPGRIAELERLIGVVLPSEYREFLIATDGGHLGDMQARCTMLTPFGEHRISSLSSASEIIELLDSWIAPRNMVCIGSGDGGAYTCLSVAGLDHGAVYALDSEMKFLWEEEKLSLWNFGPEAKEFFRQRDEGGLPPRPWGYENCYHIADCFGEFLSKLHPELRG